MCRRSRNEFPRFGRNGTLRLLEPVIRVVSSNHQLTHGHQLTVSLRNVLTDLNPGCHILGTDQVNHMVGVPVIFASVLGKLPLLPFHLSLVSNANPE
jgi:hypothetical protein